MSGTDQPDLAGSVEPMSRKPHASIVTDELTKVMALVTGACPDDAKASFLFDDKLHIMIDLRTLKHVRAVEMILPKLGVGMFPEVQRGQAPHHSFRHRVTARLDHPVPVHGNVAASRPVGEPNARLVAGDKHRLERVWT